MCKKKKNLFFLLFTSKRYILFHMKWNILLYIIDYFLQHMKNWIIISDYENFLVWIHCSSNCTNTVRLSEMRIQVFRWKSILLLIGNQSHGVWRKRGSHRIQAPEWSFCSCHVICWCWWWLVRSVFTKSRINTDFRALCASIISWLALSRRLQMLTEQRGLQLCALRWCYWSLRLTLMQ